MTDQSKTSNPKTSKGSTSATFSQALEDGHTHSNSQDGMHLDLFGQAVAPVKVSQLPDKEKAQMTSVTYGQNGFASSASQSLQQSLASKLLERLDSVGLTPSQQILKRVTTDLLRPYCQDTLQEPITVGSDYGSWPTPRSRDGTAGASKLNENGKRQSDTTGIQFGATLKDSVHMWSTPNTMDHLPVRSDEALKKQATTQRKGRTSPANLREQVDPEFMEKWKEATWPTPCASDHRDRGIWESPAIQRRVKIGKSIQLTMLVGSLEERGAWPTPRSSKAMTDSVESSLKRMKKMGYEGKLEQAVALTGEQSIGLDVKTGKPARFRLNPKFSLWLMGYPKSWINKAIPENTVTQGHSKA